jgi:Domain of unknown function (DUF1508)
MTSTEEPKVLTITTFERHGERVIQPTNENGEIILPTDPEDDGPEEWYWHTQTTNGEVVGDGAEGYNRLSGAVQGFFAQQGVDPDDASLSAPYSKLEKVNDNVYQIKKFATEDDETE